MCSVDDHFKEEKGHFTLFVVDQDFANTIGKDYFRSYINTENFINSKRKIQKSLKRTLETIEKSIEPVSSLVSFISPLLSGISVPKLSMGSFLSAICRLFTVHEHQAAGPDVIDPIIIQEGKVTVRDLLKIVNLYKDSVLRPTIIIILQDNNYQRASKYLKECPDGTYIKYINSNAQSKIIRIVNSGVDNIEEFINAFSDQCFSTCSNTKRDVLLNQEYETKNVINLYSAQLFRVRTNLIFDKKAIIKNELNKIINELVVLNCYDESEQIIRNCYLCISLLFRVFCNDGGTKDIIEANNIAMDLDNNILLAQVYRYADFFDNIARSEKEELLSKGYDIFHQNTMEDHAIYCKNNLLVNQFSTNYVNQFEFKELQEEAAGGVPGMVGLSHIYNNVGIAFLYNSLPSTAIDYFEKGLDYARNDGRLVQNLALKINIAIAKCYMYEKTEEKDLKTLLRQTIDAMRNNLQFIGARYVMNIIAIAFWQNPKFGQELIDTSEVISLVNHSMIFAPFGLEQLILQIKYLTKHFSNFPSNKFIIPNVNTEALTGARRHFIETYGLNPFHFKTWL